MSSAFVVGQSLSRVQLFVTLWTAAYAEIHVHKRKKILLKIERVP